MNPAAAFSRPRNSMPVSRRTPGVASPAPGDCQVSERGARVGSSSISGAGWGSDSLAADIPEEDILPSSSRSLWARQLFGPMACRAGLRRFSWGRSCVFSGFGRILVQRVASLAGLVAQFLELARHAAFELPRI